MPPTGEPEGEPDGGDHRQPEREKRRKRGRHIDPHGYDAGKKVNGKKRPILVDTQGLILQAIVHAADIQDRDGGVWLSATLFRLFPFLLRLFADGGYQGPEGRQRHSGPGQRGNRQVLGPGEGLRGAAQTMAR
jgi:hypothetical protein